MRKVLTAVIVALPLGACYTADPTATGAIVGGAGGAAIGAAATGRVEGAVVGGAVGATTGALVGSAGRQRAARCVYDDYYGREVCYY